MATTKKAAAAPEEECPPDDPSPDPQMPGPDPQAATPADVKKMANYLGVSVKGVQICLDRGYTAKQAAQYLGVSSVAIQRAMAKFNVISVGISGKAGLTVTVAYSGSTPSGTVVVSWGDTQTSNAGADASGNGTVQHTYAGAGTYSIGATQGGRSATPVSVTVP
jgi:hypothetical protein